jgi:hypothetical protein
MTGYLTRSLSKLAGGDVRYTVALSLLVYVAMLPPMIVAGQGFQLAPAPRGTKVEQVFPRRASSRVVVGTRIFVDAGEWSRIVLYENANRLSPAHYEVKPFGSDGWATIELRSSDKTDPIRNGRRYYVVLP